MANAEGFLARARAPFSRQARPLNGLPKILASSGDFDVVLATTKKEIRRAQKLRYKVFFEEGGATPDPTARLIRRDVCRYDEVCDHLIVVDKTIKRIDGAPTVVGAYRLLRQDVAEANFGFYSAGEFQIGALLARHPHKRFLELGRSCVARERRGKRTLELLWRGVWVYALHFDVDVMFGCASFPGADPRVHAAALRSLRLEATVVEDWDVAAVSGRGVGPLPIEAGQVEARMARTLPPLIKGYLRLGARFSGDAVVDEAFGTTDVLVVLRVEEIRSRYLAHFAPTEVSSPLAA
jgi:putative hemolysin